MDAASQRGIDDVRLIRDNARAPAGRGPLQGLHPRRGAPADRRGLECASEDRRGAAAASRLRLLHDVPRQGAAPRFARAARRSCSRARGCPSSWPAAAGGGRRGVRRAGRRARTRRACGEGAASETRSRRSTSWLRRRAARSPSSPCFSCSARWTRRRSSASATSSSTATPAGALTHVEELSEQGQDIGRLVVELLEHLRHLLLVQHLGEVPDNVP